MVYLVHYKVIRYGHHQAKFAHDYNHTFPSVKRLTPYVVELMGRKLAEKHDADEKDIIICNAMPLEGGDKE